MRLAGLFRPLAALAATSALVLASPAWANSTISINPGNVPTTAAGFSSHECSSNLGGGPYADKDVWVFNLPSQGGASGSFVSVTATFSTPSGTQTKTIPTDGGQIVTQGISRAIIAVPAGWTLTGATAVITGTATQFVLTHTCPSSGSTPSPSPSASSPGSVPSGSPSPSTSASASPTTSPTDPGTSGSPSVDPTSPGTQPPLPRTGAAITTMLTAGVIVTAAGAAMLWLLRRRRAALTTLED